MTEFNCRHLEEALRSGGAGIMAQARAHAEGCAACREELSQWDALSAAAATLHREWESPELWGRIEQSLSREMRPKPSIWHLWRPAFGAVAVLLVAIAMLWTVRRPTQATTASRQFLTEKALAEVEASEAAYAKSIEALAKLAQPALDASASPLLDSYREKLAVLDAAIGDLKADARRNALNASLRLELVTLYREKQKTLTEVLNYANSTAGSR